MLSLHYKLTNILVQLDPYEVSGGFNCTTYCAEVNELISSLHDSKSYL